MTQRAWDYFRLSTGWGSQHPPAASRTARAVYVISALGFGVCSGSCLSKARADQLPGAAATGSAATGSAVTGSAATGSGVSGAAVSGSAATGPAGATQSEANTDQ